MYTYWNRRGTHQVSYDEFQLFLGLYQDCISPIVAGEIWRAATVIYYDYYNNGFENNWASFAQYLINFGYLSTDVKNFLVEYGTGLRYPAAYDAGWQQPAQIECFMDQTIEFLSKNSCFMTEKNFVDSQKTSTESFIEEDYLYEDDMA